ncbi:cytochrome P450, partial [Chytriomyces sp. MP71]
MVLTILYFPGQGLFTNNADDPDWILGHKILMPAFSPKAIKAYGHEMGHLANKLALIFDQFADSGEAALMTRWMTNFTFETIGLTGFGYSFGMLETKDAEIHPFLKSMAFCLQESVARISQLPVYKTLPLPVNYRYDKELGMMQATVSDVIKTRKEMLAKGLEVPKDLLTFMLTEKSNGIGMSDELIRDQVLTFLIAGHDTTSNTLAWCLFELDRNPHVQDAILQELVNVGIQPGEIPTEQQISQLVYVERVIKETLRMHAPARAVGKTARKDVVLPGNYFIPEGTRMAIAIDATHQNPAVYERPEVFDPDRFLPENENKRSPFAWIPFSYGARGCIGRQFA